MFLNNKGSEQTSSKEPEVSTLCAKKMLAKILINKLFESLQTLELLKIKLMIQ